MRAWQHPNMDGFTCPICKTDTDAPVVLVGIPGTEQDGIMEAEQIHAECYQVYAKMHGVEIKIEC